MIVQQGHLFNKTVLVERELSTGSVLRLKLEPLEGKKVRVVEYYRKGFLSEKFKRNHGEEGKVFAFEDLRLNESFSALFE